MAYQEFAYFYDEFNGEADYDALYAKIKAELDAHGIHDGILLDMGCGTGELTLMLTQAGYDMIGVDQSEEMLAVVRDKADQLGISERLLLLRPDLERTIQNAAFFMEEGGVLLFDMNTPYKHQHILGENTFTLEGPDANCVWHNHWDEANQKVDISIGIDYQDTGEHFDEQFSEYTYSLEQIRAALEKYGFRLESVCDGETFEELTETSPRYFMCAVKQYTQTKEG